MSETHNLFVYGTLRKGESRNYILKDLPFDVGLLLDYKKVKPEELGFPFIVEDEGSKVEGEVYYGLDEELMTKIDIVEGEGNLYHRIAVKVKTREGELVDAYTYYPSDRLINKYT
ncbi:MAG: gamma-glutamylcyclotransferase family protein [Promethearchaeia archaeon]